jgi:hypothetical protein
VFLEVPLISFPANLVNTDREHREYGAEILPEIQEFSHAFRVPPSLYRYRKTADPSTLKSAANRL